MASGLRFHSEATSATLKWRSANAEKATEAFGTGKGTTARTACLSRIHRALSSRLVLPRATVPIPIPQTCVYWQSNWTDKTDQDESASTLGVQDEQLRGV